jgi:hypothetical protein
MYRLTDAAGIEPLRLLSELTRTMERWPASGNHSVRGPVPIPPSAQTNSIILGVRLH